MREPRRVHQRDAAAGALIVREAGGANNKAAPSVLSASGTWHEGQWTITYTYPLGRNHGGAINLQPGRYFPISFADWDGWDGQAGNRHAMTGWQWLYLEPSRPVAKSDSKPARKG